MNIAVSKKQLVCLRTMMSAARCSSILTFTKSGGVQYKAFEFGVIQLDRSLLLHSSCKIVKKRGICLKCCPIHKLLTQETQGHFHYCS